MNPRELTLKTIHAALDPESALTERDVLNSAERLSAVDRGLYQELSHGVLREYLYLQWVVSRFSSKPPKAKVRDILFLSAYQLLFLDRIPAFAIFSEAKKQGMQWKLSEAERKFIHAVLKKIEVEKMSLRQKHDDVLKKLLTGAAPESELDYAVLNATPNFVKTLSIEGSPSAARALAAMKNRATVVGYALPGEKVFPNEATPLPSQIAPRALALKMPVSPGIRVQGEASQWACEVAAKALLKQSDQTPLRILEIACGRGGKLLGTLTALSALGDVPPLEWHCVDSSKDQLAILKTETFHVVQKYWPQVKLSSSQTVSGEMYDFVWLDAPCTGFGTLSKLPQIALTRGKDAAVQAKTLSKLQVELMRQGVDAMGKSGAFLYTVCTLTKAETLDVVDECKSLIGRAPERVEFLWPGSEPAPQAEGFFLALFI